MSEGNRQRKNTGTIRRARRAKPSRRRRGRPRRDKVISRDDVLNLLIALNTSTSMDEFLEEI